MPELTRGRALVRCKVSLGMFANERGVRIELPNGESVSALVDASQVQVEKNPRPGEEVDGYLWVSVIGDTEGKFVIDLPQQTLTGGTRVSVAKTLVRSAA